MSLEKQLHVNDSIETLLQETRVFYPLEDFKEQANVDEPVYQEAKTNRIGFWEHQAKRLDWFKKWEKALVWNPPFAKWFIGGRLNACYNCVDRHINSWRKNKAALIWEGEPGDQKTLTYNDLSDPNVIKKLQTLYAKE